MINDLQKIRDIFKNVGIITVYCVVIFLSIFISIFIFAFISRPLHELYTEYGYVSIMVDIIVIFLYVGILVMSKNIFIDDTEINYKKQYILTLYLWTLFWWMIATIAFLIILFGIIDCIGLAVILI